MALLGIDLGGTKLALAVFTEQGSVISKWKIDLDDRKGPEVGKLITGEISQIIHSQKQSGKIIKSIGISVPGIFNIDKGTVWAPNIPGWENYPLLGDVLEVNGRAPVTIDSDRACYVLGEVWKGNARDCKDVIFLAVGTGIGAGIMINGEMIRGSHNIAGAIGWMALNRPFSDQYADCGCFEYHASGEGIATIARRYLMENNWYKGELRNRDINKITSHDIFKAYEYNDPLATRVIEECIEFWGMAVANLISLFNPEKIILGGGIFGPAVSLISRIKEEAARWAQPVSIKQMTLEASALSGDAGVYGAAFLALKSLNK
jgi:glucokinase